MRTQEVLKQLEEIWDKYVKSTIQGVNRNAIEFRNPLNKTFQSSK